jgi:hypothetical protein
VPAALAVIQQPPLDLRGDVGVGLDHPVVQVLPEPAGLAISGAPPAISQVLWLCRSPWKVNPGRIAAHTAFVPAASPTSGSITIRPRFRSTLFRCRPRRGDDQQPHDRPAEETGSLGDPHYLFRRRPDPLRHRPPRPPTTPQRPPTPG